MYYSPQKATDQLPANFFAISFLPKFLKPSEPKASKRQENSGLACWEKILSVFGFQCILLLLTAATQEKEGIVIPVLGSQEDNLGTGIN